MHWRDFRHGGITGADIEHVLSLRFASALPVPVEAFARYLGVECETWGDTTSLLVTRKHTGLWLATHDERERRYAIAHGLGHLIYGDTRVRETQEHKHTRNHIRADEFAATLLMPAASWVAATDAMGENSGALARYYLVPERLVHLR